MKTVKETKKSWWKVLLCELFGLALLIFPVLVFISLLSYDAADPSINKAGAGEIHNSLGMFGACVADAVLSTFGLALIIFLFVLLQWGYSLVRYQTFPEYKSRIFAWFVGLLSFAAFLDMTCRTYLGGFSFPYNLTGEWSRVLSSPLNTYVNRLNIPYNTFILEGIILFVSVLSFNFAAGITCGFWLRLCGGVLIFCRKILQFLVSTFKKTANIRSFREFKELNPSYLQNTFLKRDSLRSFKRQEPVFGAENASVSVKTVAQPVSAAAAVNVNNETAATGGLIIEAPAQNGGSAALRIPESEVPARSRYNPTFSFISEGDYANQNVKKLTPEDIYKTEGVKVLPERKTAKPAAKNMPVQEDLLSVPAAPAEPVSGEVRAQQPAQTAKPAAKPVPEVEKSVSAEETYQLPDINLLSIPQGSGQIVYDEKVLQENAVRLEEVLKDFGIRGKIVKVRPGPVVTLYELEPAPGTRTARVIGLSDDIARSMAVASVRMAVVSGQKTIGIELPNEKRETVWLRELLEDPEFKNSKNILNVTLGKDIGGGHVYADLSKMPHLLVAGTTGSGKSVGVNSMILSLLYRMTPDQCRLIMIDPKQLEFSMYNGIPHLLTPVITDPAKAVVGLKWAVREMEDRYRAMSQLNVRNIAGYNQKVADMRKTGKEIKKTIQVGFDKETGKPLYEEQVINTSPMPYIVIVVDEMADLMLVAGKEVEAAIQRLAQMARAAGIHLIMSTQRPSVDVITGTIKANFPSRISFHVTTKIDSRTILGEQGAEQLLGMGDMLYMPSGLRPIRVHGCFVTDGEVEAVVNFIKEQGEPKYVADVTEGELNSKNAPAAESGGSGSEEDDLYDQAVAIVRNDKKASTSYLQRKLRLGYNRAAILIERMEDEGVITPPDHVGRREVIGVN